MTISFDQIPANIRTPGAFVEFNNELAGANFIQFKLLVLGQRLSTGTVDKLVPTLVTTDSAADRYFGRGSMLSEMLKAVFSVTRNVETWAVALDDLPAGVAATGSVSFSGTAMAAKTLYLFVAGHQVPVGVANGDTAATVANNLIAAINIRSNLPVTASAGAAGVVNLTAKNKGEVGNGIDLRFNYYGHDLPAGITPTITAMSGGAGDPDIAPVFSVIGDEWYNWIASPWSSDANFNALRDELESRWGPMRQIGSRAFMAFPGTLSNASTYGNSKNSELISTMAINSSPTPSYIWAAINAATAAASLGIDPARPLQRLKLKGVLPPAIPDRWSREERNILLYDGMSTFTVNDAGEVFIERQVTMYQKNDAGLSDASYLDINTLETLERVRFEQRAHILQRYPRHKVASDGTNYGAGQAVVTPSIIRAELLALYRNFEEKGWCEGFEEYAETLVVERDSENPNRINWLDHPNLVNQLRIVAGKAQFIL